MTLYIKILQEDMKEGIESGMLNPEQQYLLIDNTMIQLLAIGAINDDAIKNHRKKIKDLTNDIIACQQKIADRYKESYEKILEL